jgi:hypothetical protein
MCTWTTVPGTMMALKKRSQGGQTWPQKATDGVLPLMAQLNENRRAGWMRQHLQLAKIDRARLTEENATTMQINFRSWRDTGITWLALQGVEVAKMQRRAGHDAMTLGYVKMAEDLTGSIGEPFPPLPPSLVADDEEEAIGVRASPRARKSAQPSGRLAQVEGAKLHSIEVIIKFGRGGGI